MRRQASQQNENKEVPQGGSRLRIRKDVARAFRIRRHARNQPIPGRGNGHLLQPSVRKFSAHYRARCRICAPRERCEEIRGRKITGNARVVAKQNALEREVQLF